MLDDEPLALKVLENYARRMPMLEPKGFFTDPQLAHQLLSQIPIDLLFLDIQMPDISGLQFFYRLQLPPLVVFSTAYRDYAVEGFELSAIDYLVKPYEFERFQKAVNKAADYLNFQNHQKEAFEHTFIFVRSTYDMLKIDLQDLYLVETCDDYLKLHLLSRKRPVYTLMTLKNMEQLLPANRFLRVHRSFLVGLDKVKSWRRKTLLVQDQEIPIGVTYLAQVKQFFAAKKQN